MQVTLTVQRHMEKTEQGLNIPGGGLRIPFWYRRCQVGGRELKKKNLSPKLIKEAVEWWELSRKELYWLTSCRSCNHIDVELWMFF